jgi:hypothetical protein
MAQRKYYKHLSELTYNIQFVKIAGSLFIFLSDL